MKTNINGVTYWVKWQHTILYNKRTGKFRGGNTICIIETQGFKTISIGTAICQSTDPYVKETGRKISLNNALLQKWPDLKILTKHLTGLDLERWMEAEEEANINKEIRGIFWDLYNNRKNEKNKTTTDH